ncbi:MAG: riboflavin synthase [Chthonomonadales bacterium]
MFTGIIEELGKVATLQAGAESVRLTVDCPLVSSDAHLGDSIGINGCCLTIVRISGALLDFEAVPETMRRTSLGQLKVGSPVNLERAVTVNQRIGGHIVQGHVDGTGTLTSVVVNDNARILTISAGPEIMKYIAAKGSVALDGISLTIAGVDDHHFNVWIIPHTWEATTLSERRSGDLLNIEVDVLAKYVESILKFATPEKNSLEESLIKAGYLEQNIAV